MDVATLEDLLARGWIAAPGTSLRDEDRKKARELVGILAEVARAEARCPRSRQRVTLVDAAAGKGYVGVIASTISPRLHVHAIERDPRRIALMSEAASRLGGRVEPLVGDVGDAAIWPAEVDVVVALHACGDASDRTIERATEANARSILIAPCCVATKLPAAERANARAEALGLPRGEVRRGFIESLVASERMLELEARGWRTEIVTFAAPSVTPYRHLLRAERLREPGRMAQARDTLARLRAA
ncbi:methyltransferase [Sandaracinus amylolyticus]|uniref:methyltransferase n=1 Tax=Sandaracinus amylolyticus TaxID=927083 RepID=UPI001F1EE96D|nr:methyltransferase [Sandaracinus amylolyticus]UJR82274.1 Hypothetical protein I5071_43390 [Sandaracinus amylolyticus]